MKTALKKFFEILTPQEKRKFWWLQCLVLVQSLAEVAATLSVLPFLQLAVNLGAIETNQNLRWIKDTLGLESSRSFAIVVGVVVMALVICTSTISLFVTRRRSRYTHNLLTSLSTRLLRGYLDRDYSFYLSINTATLAKNVLAETNELVNNFINPVMSASARVVPMTMIIASVALVDWRAMILLTVLISGTYVAVDLSIRRRQQTLGEQRVKGNMKRYRILQETFGTIKETKLHGLEEYQVRRFEPAARMFANAKGENERATQAPKYVIETVIFGGLIGFSVYNLSIGNDLAQMAPELGFFALVVYRLLPSVQEIFRSLAAVRFNLAALDNLASQMRTSSRASRLGPASPRQPIVPIPLTRELVLEGITFRYDEQRPFSFDKVSLRIPARSTVGFVGRSGTGKSTIADIILGLLRPQEGAVIVDGRVIDEFCQRAWQHSVGYVPQTINLTDATISENIAFGAKSDDIDRERVIEVARIADLHEFVMNHLPEKYETGVGEKGVRLSGGQKQRIGIARALYRNPSLLVFDEATSALDSQTEEAVLGAIQRLAGKLTMIIIAHRRSTLAFCDEIFQVEGGRIFSERYPTGVPH